MPFEISYLQIGSSSAIVYGLKDVGQFVRAAYLVRPAGGNVSTIFPPQGDDPSTWPAGSPADTNWMLLFTGLVPGRYVIILRPDCRSPIYLDFLIPAAALEGAGFFFPAPGAQIQSNPNGPTQLWAYGSTTHALAQQGTDATVGGNQYAGAIVQPGPGQPWVVRYDIPMGVTGATALQVTNTNVPPDNPQRNVTIV